MNRSETNRRRFLQEAAALREFAGGRVAVRNDLPAAEGRFVTSVRRRAMACDWEVQLASARGDGALEYVLAALDLVEKLEDQLTVYRNDSEVIRINRGASTGPVVVERRLFDLLLFAERLYRETGGAMDITSGPLSQAWGFSRRNGRLPSDKELADALALVGMQHVVLDEDKRTIAIRHPGTTINLNCIGKGYALDRMAELLSLAGVNDYLLHGGKSSVLARGAQPGMIDPDIETRRIGEKVMETGQSLNRGSFWTIGLRHPLRPQVRLAEFYLRDQSLSTSGSGTQFFRHRGRRYGHLLDPRTGWPVEGVHSVTVVAPTAVEADALSTAFYVMGPDKVAEYCASRSEISALFVMPSPQQADVDLLAFNLGDSAWRRLSH